MITGYNTDIKHGSRVFHVQTEDNGVANPSVVTLIYVGGEILASKKSSYADQAPLDEKKILEMMETQHRRMIAAIKKGKFDGPTLPADPLADDDTDVSKAPPMISTTAVARKTGAVPRPTEQTSAPRPPAQAPMLPPGSLPRGSTVLNPPPSPPPRSPAPTLGATRPGVTPPKSKEAGAIQISDRTLDQVIIDYLANESQHEHLELSIASHGDIFSGDSVELRVSAKTAVSQEPIVGAEVLVKVISTVDKPVVAFRGKTTGDGTCLARFKVPDFNEGNAAVIITASSPHGNDEIKQLVKRRR